MRVSDWFGAFALRHMERHPRPDWPQGEEGEHFWAAWAGNFRRAGLTPEVADEASERLAGEPPRYVGEHLPSLLLVAKAVFRERAEADGTAAAPDDRAAALLASLDCDDCSGQGLTTRYRLRSAGEGWPPAVVLLCCCPFGRWMERRLRLDDPATRRRLLDLADHPWLRLGPVPWSDRPDNPHRYHPDDWDSYGNRPIPREPHRPRALARSLADAMAADGPGRRPAAPPRPAPPPDGPIYQPAATTQRRGSWGPPPDWEGEAPF